MYAKKIHLRNYGPIEHLEVELPFEGGTPKPVVLVGANGSGKSILLSHIVNSLIIAKDFAFPGTPEVEENKVYKLRSSAYIKQATDYYFSRVDFEGGFFVSELRTTSKKEDYPAMPTELAGSPAESVWNQMGDKERDSFIASTHTGVTTREAIEEAFKRNCVLYFPFNRYEEPAWLNEENLRYRARHMDAERLVGYTNRKVIALSPLQDNQDWLFDVLFDRVAFEVSTIPVNLPTAGGSASPAVSVFQGYSGGATRTYNAALEIVRAFTRRSDARFGIGRRHDRRVSIHAGTEQLVPNIFQLSSGETSLLNLFLSILRDFDLSRSPFSGTDDIRGVVVVDEIDLHLHAIHQYEVLPSMIRMFPNVQFIVTTHSPLFVLGMKRALGEDGYGLYRLPQCQEISSEEFSEFGEAYQTFVETSRFSEDIRIAIESAQTPIVFVEGTTGQRYLKKASEVLSQEDLLERVEVRDGGGSGDLKKVWSNFKSPLADIVPRRVVLLFDCDEQVAPDNRGDLFRRTIPFESSNPIQKGIENLFSKDTLEKALQHKPAFVDIDPGRTKMVRGKPESVPEEWAINEHEKSNLCDWLCANGTQDDFEGFAVVFELLRELLDPRRLAISSGR